MEVKEIATMRAIAMLKAANCMFIIVKENGETLTHGDLKLAEPEPANRTGRPRVPFKSYWNAYHPVVKDLQPGEAVVVPYGDLNPEGLQSSCTAWCITQWGKGSTMTHRNDTGLEVLRVA